MAGTLVVGKPGAPSYRMGAGVVVMRGRWRGDAAVRLRY